MESILLAIALLAPLLSGAAISFFGSSLGERSGLIGIAALWASALSSVATLTAVLQGGPIKLILLAIHSGSMSYSIVVDRLAAVMMVLITSVSLVIHVYSRRYMVGDPGYVHFFSLLGLLTFVLLNLVTSGNLLWLFFYWHLVTWLLVTLISFRASSPAAVFAGRRTLRIQGIGDAAFAIAILVLYSTCGTLDLAEIFAIVGQSSVQRISWFGSGLELDVASVTTLLLLVSVMTKSAQFPFHIWLPGTIEAPTPVSALLHAGIVNAGGFLVNRLAPLFGLAPTTLHLMFLIGGLTALIGAATMLTQSSVKRTLVYSTMGQMGYMVMECGLGAFALAVFHLCAHGLFKATLFLNSGANIHKARTEFKLPGHYAVRETPAFSFVLWATGLAMTLVLPLVILLIAHGLVNIPLFETQGTVIFLFFAWVTSAQAIFSLYRLNGVGSWNVSVTMIATLAFIGLTYLWAGEAFTHFLYPEPGQVGAYFQAAAWNRNLFDAFVGLSALLIVAVWVVLYGQAHGMSLLLPAWLEKLQTRLYVAFLNGLYVEDAVQALRTGFGRMGPRSRPGPVSDQG
jgi:NADH-quinone oxidoreductase subunit L